MNALQFNAQAGGEMNVTKVTEVMEYFSVKKVTSLPNQFFEF